MMVSDVARLLYLGEYGLSPASVRQIVMASPIC